MEKNILFENVDKRIPFEILSAYSNKQKNTDLFKNNKNELLIELESEEPKMKGLMLKIVEFLEHNPNINEVGANTFVKYFKKKYEINEILEALLNLCILKKPYLDLQYTLYDNDNFINLTKEDIKEGERTGEFVHPKTGAELLFRDVESNILINFVRKWK